MSFNPDLAFPAYFGSRQRAATRFIFQPLSDPVPRRTSLHKAIKMNPTDATESNPPAYNSLGPSKEEADAVEKLWDKHQHKGWTEQGDLGRPNLSFVYTCRLARQSRLNPKRIFRNRKNDTIWAANLHVWSQNIPRLMLHGFYWPPQDFIPGAGDLDVADPSTPPHSGISYRRYRYASSSLSNQRPEWYATLSACAQDISTLKNLNLDWVTMGALIKVRAQNWTGNTVYLYDARGGQCSNMIYDQMPMEGWWPWPKTTRKGGDSSKKDHDKVTGMKDDDVDDA